jgi:Fe-S cluster assembly ATP-binding protein
MTDLLSVRGLSIQAGDRAVLTDVDLTVEEREVHALVGANGAGKSSLAYAVMGLPAYTPVAGEIMFAGESLAGLPVHERARRGITLAWQEPARFEGLTVADYLRLGRRDADVAGCLERVGLAPGEYLRRPIDRTLSGGERKRVELAAVLAMRPRLAILDEPASGIDLVSVTEILKVIQGLRREGAALLAITHREDVAVGADRATQLCGGRVVCRGAPDEVIRHFKARRCVHCDGEACGHVRA